MGSGISLRDLVLLTGLVRIRGPVSRSGPHLCLEPDLRVAGRANAWCVLDYDVAGDEGQPCERKETSSATGKIIFDVVPSAWSRLQDAAYGEILRIFDLVCGRDERPNGQKCLWTCYASTVRLRELESREETSLAFV